MHVRDLPTQSHAYWMLKNALCDLIWLHRRRSTDEEPSLWEFSYWCVLHIRSQRAIFLFLAQLFDEWSSFYVFWSAVVATVVKLRYFERRQTRKVFPALVMAFHTLDARFTRQIHPMSCVCLCCCASKVTLGIDTEVRETRGVFPFRFRRQDEERVRFNTRDGQGILGLAASPLCCRAMRCGSTVFSVHCEGSILRHQEFYTEAKDVFGINLMVDFQN